MPSKLPWKEMVLISIVFVCSAHPRLAIGLGNAMQARIEREEVRVFCSSWPWTKPGVASLWLAGSLTRVCPWGRILSYIAPDLTWKLA